MAGTLKTYDMPNLTVAAKKRERADVQDEMWKNAGLQPIEGKVQEEDAREVLTKLSATEKTLVDEEQEFLKRIAAAVGSRIKPEGGETKAWTRVEYAYNSYMKLRNREAFEELKQAYFDFSSFPPAQPGEKNPQKKKNTSLLKLIDFAKDALKMGIFYLEVFMGMVATRLADRNVGVYFAKRMPIYDENIDTIEDFVRKNTHLGPVFLEMLLSQYRIYDPDNEIFKNLAIEQEVSKFFSIPAKDDPVPPFVGNDISSALFVTTGNFLSKILGNAGEVGIVVDEKRQWVFSVIDLAALSQILTEGSLGAIMLAHAQIQRIPNCMNFTLKQLLMSDGVRDMFAIFVAFQYQLASGGNAYAGRASTQGNVKGTTFMLSAGIETRNMLSKLVLGAQDWFRDVYETQNPLYVQIRRDINDKKQQRTASRGVREDWKRQVDARAKDKEAIPLFEGVVKNPKFTTISQPDQQYVRLTLEILQREQFLNGIPEKILKRVN